MEIICTGKKGSSSRNLGIDEGQAVRPSRKHTISKQTADILKLYAVQEWVISGPNPLFWIPPKMYYPQLTAMGNWMWNLRQTVPYLNKWQGQLVHPNKGSNESKILAPPPSNAGVSKLGNGGILRVSPQVLPSLKTPFRVVSRCHSCPTENSERNSQNELPLFFKAVN